MPRMGLSLSILAILVACGEEADIPGRELPQMEVSSDRIDFGEAAWGETILKTITIRNTGASPLGVSNIAIGLDEMEENFTLHLGTLVSCGEASSDQNEQTEPEEGEDTGISTDDASADAGAAPTDFGSVIVIEEDCSYDFQVSLSPTSVGAIYGSVVMSQATTKTPMMPTRPSSSKGLQARVPATSSSAPEPSTSPTLRRAKTPPNTWNSTTSATVP